MKDAKAKKEIRTKDFVEALKGLLREHIVGIVQEEEEGAFSFLLPGGKTFYISAEERVNQAKKHF